MEYILPPFKCDNIHFNGQEIDGYNKVWNLIVSSREAGKSVFLWKKVYNSFKDYGQPSLILRRYAVDITSQFIEDIFSLIEKFTGTRIPFTYRIGDIRQGMIDIKLEDKVFVRIIALNTPMSRLKSMMLKDVRYIMLDEFIVNVKIGERYLTDEPMRVKEIYTTYNRESKSGIKVYFFGNNYSMYSPYLSWLNIDSNKLKPGCILAGDLYAIQLYQINEELKQKILSKNSLYQFDNIYADYAFNGLSAQDNAIRIIPKQPEGFKLYYCFKLHNKILGVYNGFDEDNEVHYWCQIIPFKDISKRRDVVCFDFGEMVNRTVLNSNNGKKLYTYLKESIRRRWIAYATIEASYFMEEIYQEI